MNQRRFRVWLLATVLLCITSFGIAEREFGQLAFALILAAAGWWTTERAVSSEWAGIPRWLANLILILVLIFSSLRIYNGIEPVSAFGLFLTSILIIKLWERRHASDYGQILTLSTFLAIGSTLNDNSLALGLVLIATFPVLLVSVLLYQVYAASSSRTPATQDTNPALQQNAWQSLRRTAALTILAAVIVAVPVFLIVPRGIGGAALGSFARPTIGRATGFSETVNLGSGGTISESPTQVMEVRVTSDLENREIGGTGRAYYLRGTVLDRYENGRWVRSQRAARDPTIITLRQDNQRVYDRFRQERPDTFINQSIKVWRAPPDSPLFAAWRALEVASDTPGQLRIESDGRMTRSGEPGVVSYQVRSRPDPFPTEALWERPNVRPVSAAIVRYAGEVLRRANIEPDPSLRPVDQDAAAVRALETHLRTTFEYTLSPNPAPIGQDPTEWFLSLERKGHCEYFASSLALLCRGVGINSRVVTGYLAYEFDASQGKYIVRESNAHAWVEVFLGPEQWREYDGTPPAWIAEHHGPPTSIAARLWRILDRVDSAWNGTVVTFDDRSRSKLLGNRIIPSSWVRDGGLYTSIRDAESHSTLKALGAGLNTALRIAIPIAAVAAIVWAYRVWRRSHPSRRSGWAFDPRTPEGQAYERFLRELRRQGLQKPDWQPLQHFLATLPEHKPATRHARDAALILSRTRFGGDAFDSSAFSKSLAQLRTLPRAQLAQNATISGDNRDQSGPFVGRT